MNVDDDHKRRRRARKGWRVQGWQVGDGIRCRSHFLGGGWPGRCCCQWGIEGWANLRMGSDYSIRLDREGAVNGLNPELPFIESRSHA